MSLRHRVVDLYKNLYHMGKEYPGGSKWFHDRLKLAFSKNKEVRDEAQIEQLIARGEFVIKEIQALYSLRKYRAMKQRYYDKDDEVMQATKKFEDSVQKL
ncbi:Protein CBG23103 [Caenorhabditis briggsae]|uniref:Complex 1 LYR protein domain-containing protein n=2 Tax=Caenorhabditis briggsae TaxID=6238 RepID=A0AAE9CZM9_CAEBR|nr:Protein CBG23103 [Caenorhabditis briggsae]ULT89299.1 hypothetical protein L3Y34_008043 [Caenorhabditis briggsae]UMM35127.1 hypothetical protein L5515_007889 [Caenorhabditis briggsae]CAP39867.1 Protein CBG23103 [Caenorhabditis briggsae]